MHFFLTNQNLAIFLKKIKNFNFIIKFNWIIKIVPQQVNIQKKKSIKKQIPRAASFPQSMVRV